MPGMATEEELAGLRELSGTAFDVEFLRLMIRHHQGGLEMAVYAAEHADVAAVRRLAATIADTQTAETTTMTELLTERGGTPSRRPDAPPSGRGPAADNLPEHDREAPVAQGIEHCPPEAGAQVRILPGAPFRTSSADRDQLVSIPPSTGRVVPVT